MISISKPYKEERGGQTYLLSRVVDETRQWDNELWFSVNPEYGEGLCDDYADAFLLLALLPAIKSGQDIKVEGRVSRKLLFNIRNTVQPIFNRVLDAPRDIRIEAQAADDILYHAKGVGCGCSLGVDSLSSFYEHFNPDTTEGYRVTHLTLFNCGQLGDVDIEAGTENFNRAVRELTPFSEAVNLPIVAVNSNVNSFFLQSGVLLLQSFVARTCACAMALQKLFGRYVYASSYALPQMEFSTYDCSHMETAYAPLLSTENFELTLSNPMKTRVDKTNYIRTNPLTPKFLQVCWAEQVSLGRFLDRKYLQGKTKRNCGWCNKCMRTLLTLEVLQDGDISMYGEIFDLVKYREHRDRFIREVFNGYKGNYFYAEIAELIANRNFPVPAELLERYKRERAGLPATPPLSRGQRVMRKAKSAPGRLCKRALRTFKRILRHIPFFKQWLLRRAARRFMRDQWETPLMGGAPFADAAAQAIKVHTDGETRRAASSVQHLERELARCFLAYGASPTDYFMLDYPRLSESKRASYLTGTYADKIQAGYRHQDIIGHELVDKFAFFQRTKFLFHRMVFLVEREANWEDFSHLAAGSRNLFVKPVTPTLGCEICKVHVEGEVQARELFQRLLETGRGWVVEEEIVQSSTLGKWNPGSVNTVRIPSIRSGETYACLAPSLSTGRAGSIVDNVEAGGIVAGINAATGVVETDGVGAGNKAYASHPDSGVPFKGEQLPEWDALLQCAKAAHERFPLHRYLALDFAHTDQGWVLLRGSTGQVLAQYADKEGRKAEWQALENQ